MDPYVRLNRCKAEFEGALKAHQETRRMLRVAEAAFDAARRKVAEVEQAEAAAWMTTIEL